MHELQDEGSAGDDAGAPWQQVPADQALQHRALSAALEYARTQ